MLRSAHELKNSTIAATDGEIGKTVDIYFDDEKWTIRYFVVDTSRWLIGRKVLISPHSLDKLDWVKREISVRLSKEQVKNSPSIDTDKPVSRQHESAYYDHYNYPYYWTGPYVWGPLAYPAGAAIPRPPMPSTAAAEVADRQRQEAESQDVHLRSVQEVMGYSIQASDGAIGHVEDFVIDDENWTIRYMVVDTRNWWPGKKVLVSPEWIRSVSWSESRVYVDTLRETIKRGPEYNPRVSVDRQYEQRLYEHHKRPGYWVP